MVKCEEDEWEKEVDVQSGGEKSVATFHNFIRFSVSKQRMVRWMADV